MSNRRNAIKTFGLGALSMAVATTPSPSFARQQLNLARIVSAFSTDADIKPLNFAPDQLEGISKKVILSHWENNYAGSVRALNTVKARLKSALEDDGFPAFVYNDLKREHLMRTGSVILHEF
jgi:Fe-Mn family superoxide dismutase